MKNELSNPSPGPSSGNSIAFIKKAMIKRTLLLLAFAFALTGASAQTPAYIQTTLINNLQYPVAFTFMPNGNFLITHKPGTISVYSPAGTFIGTFYNMSDSVINAGERGLLGIEIDPDFAANRYVYVYYNHICCVSTQQNGPQYIRIVRFTENNNVGTNPTVIFQHATGTIPGFHVGGNLRFRPSEPDKIYFTIGDIGTMNNAQLLTNPYGKVIRINKDGTIPTDNPFYDDGNPLTGNDDRIWDYGHRNHFDLCPNPVNDSLYYSENGSSPANNGADEAGMIIRGKNNGWPTCEAFDNYNSTNPCSNPSYLPLAEFPPVNNTMPAVTGIMVYTGNGFWQLTNHLLVADVNFGRISDITLGNAPYYDQVISNVVWADFTNGAGFTTIKQGLTDGCIYALEAPYSTTMRLHRICPDPNAVPEFGSDYFSFVNVMPNPSAGSFTIKWNMLEEGNVNVSVYDVAGKKVSTVLNEYRPVTMHTLDLDKHSLGLKEGIYFITITLQSSDGTQYTQTRKLVLTN
jgi:glucose/arabinose dehydrogenase